jgi:hypothetical protein
LGNEHETKNLPNENLESPVSPPEFNFYIRYFHSLLFFSLPLLVAKSLLVNLLNGAKGFSIIILIFMNHLFWKKFRKEKWKETSNWKLVFLWILSFVLIDLWSEFLLYMPLVIVVPLYMLGFILYLYF